MSRPTAKLSVADAYLSTLSAGSRRSMAQVLGRAAHAWLGRGIDAAHTPWEKLTAAEAHAIRDALCAELGASSVNKALSGIRGVTRAARDVGRMPAAEAERILAIAWVPVDAAGAVHDRVLGQVEVDRLMRAFAFTASVAAMRDAALISTLLVTGMRRAELVALDLADYAVESGELRVKGSLPERDRTVTLPAFATRPLAEWLAARRHRPGPLFLPVNKGGRVTPRRMTAQAVYDLVRRIGRRVGVNDLTSRCLRRTCAVALVATGLPLDEVRAHLGHATWLTTAAYAKLAAHAGPRAWRCPERTNRRQIQNGAGS